MELVQVTPTVTITDPLLLEMIEQGLISESDAASTVGLNSTPPMDDDEALALDSQVEGHEALRREVYDSQPAESDLMDHVEAPKVLSDADIAPMITTKVAKTRTPRVKTEAKPRETRLAAHTTLGEYVAHIAGEKLVLEMGSTYEVDTAAFVNSVKAIKIREKVVNLFEHLYKKRNLSVFTLKALALLREKNRIHMKDLVAEFMKDYSIGTSRSQAQQEISMFKMLKITTETGLINLNSTLLDLLP